MLNLIKTLSALLAQHKTRGFSRRKTSKEGHAEKSGVVLYVYAAHFLSLAVIRQISANHYWFREPSSSRTEKRYPL